MVIIYPVIELNDLVYAHRYGWLDALTKVTEGVMLRPEAALGPIFRSGVTIKGYLRARYGLPKEPLDRLKIMMDHGISGTGFREAVKVNATRVITAWVVACAELNSTSYLAILNVSGQYYLALSPSPLSGEVSIEVTGRLGVIIIVTPKVTQA